MLLHYSEQCRQWHQMNSENGQQVNSLGLLDQVRGVWFLLKSLWGTM